jgi:hypothetical protein
LQIELTIARFLKLDVGYNALQCVVHCEIILLYEIIKYRDVCFMIFGCPGSPVNKITVAKAQKLQNITNFENLINMSIPHYHWEEPRPSDQLCNQAFIHFYSILTTGNPAMWGNPPIWGIPWLIATG